MAQRRPLAPDLRSALGYVLVGCLINVVVMEWIFRRPAGRDSGKLLTFGHFCFIGVEGATSLVTRRAGGGLGLRPRSVPLPHVLLLTGLFWATNLSNNVVFSYDISVPLHTVFRSLQLVSSMALGFAIIGRRYTGRQVLAVLLATAGVLLATLSSAGVTTGGLPRDPASLGRWLTGLALLALSVLLASLNGLAQEAVVQRMPPPAPGALPAWKEIMALTHLCGLPVFLLLAGDLRQQLHAYLSDPTLLLLWGVNVVSQWMCISGVLQFTQLTDALTVTMVITLRKILSLFLSVYLFGSAFSWPQCAGAALTFGGGLLYSLPAHAPAREKEKVG